MKPPAEPGLRPSFEFGGIVVHPGTRKDIRMKISEFYTATAVFVPVTVVHGSRKGPTLFVTAAVHGNELNGIEMVRRVRAEVDPRRLTGTLLLVAVANPVAFFSQNRDLPDGRDLNRHFPGRARGSMASHMAEQLFRKIVERSDWGIDLHTAGRGRTNLPHIRADLKVQAVRRLAHAFGCEVILDLRGENGMLRRSATRVGIPTIVYEAGEPLRFQEGVIRHGVRGIKNVIADLKMYPFARVPPHFQVVVEDRRWVRARHGGILILNVKPGDIIEKRDVIAFNTKPFGTELNRIVAPYTGLVVGTSTIPMVTPGSAVCHLMKLGARAKIIRNLLRRHRMDFE